MNRFSLRHYLLFSALVLVSACGSGPEGYWEFEIDGDSEEVGIMLINHSQVSLNSYSKGPLELAELKIDKDSLTGSYLLGGQKFTVKGKFQDSIFNGSLFAPSDTSDFVAIRLTDKPLSIDRGSTAYMLTESELDDSEKNIDHAGIIEGLDREALINGARIYNANCINCHGNPEIAGSIPLSTKFWKQPLKAGSDLFSMYQTVSRGFGSMPPQLTLTPLEKYHVLFYIQQEFFRKSNREQYFSASPGYLSGLPEGDSFGPEIQPYHPWSDMDYGNFFY